MKSTYKRDVTTPPESIATQGRCSFGTFNGGINNLNFDQIDQPLGWPAPSFFNNFRLKEWQAFEISSNDWLVCVAVYNTKLSGLAIVMAFNKTSRTMYRYERQTTSSALTMANGLDNSICSYHGKDFSINFSNYLDDGKFDIEVNIQNYKDLPDFRGSWQAQHTTEPCVIVQPFGKNRPLYSHKALMPLHGKLQHGSDKFLFLEHQSAVIIDDHKGYYPYTLQYDWLTALGVDGAGKPIGFNLTDNQVKNPERYNENCLWQNAQMITLPPIKISRPDGVMGIWQVRDSYGQVELDFEPEHDVVNQLNLGIVRTDYHGVFGKVKGGITKACGEKINFDGYYGMGEDKYIRL